MTPNRAEHAEVSVGRPIRRGVLLCLAVAALMLAGCTLWPSSWWPGGSPLDRAKASALQRDQISAATVAHAQAAVHKAATALDAAPASRPVAVARDFVTEARALLDQAHGAPSAGDEAEWNRLVHDLLSENAAVRAAAEKERTAQAGATARLADQLARATAAAERANTKALAYAADREELADFAGKLKLGFFAVLALVALGTVLSLVARFVPAVGLASQVVNGVLAPGLTFVAHRAEVGLRRVGQGMTRLRSLVADAEPLIERAFDGLTDADHQRMISAGAKLPPSSP